MVTSKWHNMITQALQKNHGLNVWFTSMLIRLAIQITHKLFLKVYISDEMKYHFFDL
jgi:hypothetical protein